MNKIMPSASISTNKRPVFSATVFKNSAPKPVHGPALPNNKFSPKSVHSSPLSTNCMKFMMKKIPFEQSNPILDFPTEKTPIDHFIKFCL
jgi:hypothetical protein